ncbi:MAG: hypothetical protein PVH37_11700 [Desulfobacterales bacterium]
MKRTKSCQSREHEKGSFGPMAAIGLVMLAIAAWPFHRRMQ